VSTILTMDKSQIRIQYKALRDKISKEEIMNNSLLIANRCLDLDIWDKQIFHLFISIEEYKEIDTSMILTILQDKDKTVVVPKIQDNKELRHFLLTDQTCFKKNSWGIPEPISGIELDTDKIDVVFLPLLAFDSKGNRVGYGKGYYDRFLASSKPCCTKIGLSLFEEHAFIFSTESNDIPLDYCITPKKIYRYKHT